MKVASIEIAEAIENEIVKFLEENGETGSMQFTRFIDLGGSAGGIVSMALILQGTLEIVLSKRSVADDLKSCSRRMAINQIGLATSLSLYFAYQMSVLEPDVLIASLLESPLYDALLMYPEDLRLKLLDGLPKMLGVFYIVVAAVAWIFCGGTALYYWIQGR